MRARALLLFTLIPLFAAAQMNPWVPALSAQYIYDMAIAPSGSIYAVSFPGGVWQSDSNGANWTSLTSPASDLVAVAITPLGHVYVGTWGHGVYRSTDNGLTWTATGPSALRVTDIASNPAGDVFVATFGDSALYRSTDDGVSWYSAIGGISFQTDPIHLDVIATGSAGLIYAAADIVYRSRDNGGHWNPIGPPSSENLLSLLITSPGHILAGGLPGVVRTTDDGSTWTTVNFGAGTGFVRCLAMDSRGRIFRGIDYGGVYTSDDGGDNWYDFSSGLLDNDVYALVANSKDVLFAATYGHGVYHTTYATAVDHDKPALPNAVTLLQNYPNPCNPRTTIRFELPSSAFVRLGVFDMLGREVASLVNSELPPGDHWRVFDGSKLASGVYVYRLSAKPPATGDLLSSHAQSGQTTTVQSKRLLLVR